MNLANLNGALASFSKHKIWKRRNYYHAAASYTIEPEADGLSVNAYARNIAGLSRAFLRSVKFRENGILINGQRVTTRGVLHAGDSLVFNMPNDRTQRLCLLRGLYPLSLKMKISCL